MTTARLALILAYSAGVIALVSSSRPEPRQSLQEHPHDRSTLQLSLAAEVLRTAVSFDGAQIGFAGLTPVEVLAWRVVYQSQARDSIFRNLLETATAPGRLYALAGLRFSLYVVGTDSSGYWLASRRLRQSKVRVLTMVGCIGSFTPQDKLVEEIDSGSWTQEFIAGHVFSQH